MQVHVSDLAQVFALLTEAALESQTGAELWNERGYYLAENEEHDWANLAREMAEKAVILGLLKHQVKEKSLSQKEVMDLAGNEVVSWGFGPGGMSERTLSDHWRATYSPQLQRDDWRTFEGPEEQDRERMISKMMM